MPEKKKIMPPPPPPPKASYTPLLVSALIVASFILGMLVTKVTYLEKGGTATAPVPTTTAVQPPVAPKVDIEKIKATENSRQIDQSYIEVLKRPYVRVLERIVTPPPKIAGYENTQEVHSTRKRYAG